MAVKKLKITHGAVNNFTYAGENGSHDIRWDTQIVGFGVRVYPSGKKAYVLSYRTTGGRKRLYTIGQVGKLTLDDARADAQSKLAEVITQGKDPALTRRELSKIKTMEEFCKLYINRYAKLRKTTWKEDQRRIGQYILPAWKNRKVITISKADIASLHIEVGETKPYEANKLLALISKMFECAIDWQLLPEHVINPARRIKKFPEETRDRWVKPEELPALAKAINNEKNTIARNAVWFYLYTGLRRNELLEAKWSDVDLKRKELRLPKTKADRVHYVPLSEGALEILETMKAIKFANNPYIFPGSKHGHHLVNIEKIWRRIRKEAKLHDVRLHDLRRTVGSWLAQDGHSLHLIGSILNHTNPETTQIYARLGENRPREALENLSSKIKDFSR